MEYKITKKINKKVIKEILKIHKEDGLTAVNFLKVAKKKGNPLHNLFDWDNTLAGEKWRLHQARMIINEVKVEVEDKVLFGFEIIAPIVESKSLDDEDGDEEDTVKVYMPIDEIRNNKEYKKQVINSALSHILYWQQKYSSYKELKPIFDSINKVKKKWEKKQ